MVNASFCYLCCSITAVGTPFPLFIFELNFNRGSVGVGAWSDYCRWYCILQAASFSFLLYARWHFDSLLSFLKNSLDGKCCGTNSKHTLNCWFKLEVRWHRAFVMQGPKAWHVLYVQVNSNKTATSWVQKMTLTGRPIFRSVWPTVAPELVSQPVRNPVACSWTMSAMVCLEACFQSVT